MLILFKNDKILDDIVYTDIYLYLYNRFKYYYKLIYYIVLTN